MREKTVKKIPAGRKAELESHGITFYATCKRCGHKWDSDEEKPKRCPSCKSTVWNKEPLGKILGRREEPLGKVPRRKKEPVGVGMNKKNRLFAKAITAPPDETQVPKVKKNITRRLMILVLSGLLITLGLFMFGIYFFTQNVVVGGPSVFLIGGGIILLKYYWGRTGDTVIEHLGEINKAQVNSMCLYPDRIVFEDTVKPVGFPQRCLNDKKNYYVLIWDKAINRLVPFTLPDQQYYDPGVFAERVLELPAHQKIFARKPNLFQKIKTGLLVVAIAIVWLLILTTTG